MTNRIADMSQRRIAIVAGFGFLLSFVGRVFSTFFVDNLIVPGDVATTASNIMASEVLFRAGIASWLVAIIGDLVRAWALYLFFKQVNKPLALLAAWFMLIHDAVFAASLLNLVFGLALVSGAGYLTVLEPNQLHALAVLFFNGYNYGFLFGLFFFSFHLGILGYLVYRARFIPKILSVLLLFASLGYLVNSTGKILLSNYPEIIWTVLSGPLVIGELALVIWLVFRGGRRPIEG